LLAAMCASARGEPLSGPDPRFSDDTVSAGEPLPPLPFEAALLDGRVDIVAAQLTVTPERQALVDFSRPMRRNVSQVAVTAPGIPAVASAEDLSGREVFVRRSSSYHDSLRALNVRLERDGRPPVVIIDAPESLEDDNLLEMVNSGLVEATVVDDYLAEFWAQVFTDMRVQRSATLRTGGELAVAFRKNSPLVEAEANEFIRQHAVGTAFGNIINRRYLQDTTFVLPAARSAPSAPCRSRPPPASGSGSATSAGSNRTSKVASNYVRYLIDRHVGTDPDELNRELLAIASYNAGPNRIRQLRREAERRGLDPNVWFANVEQVVSERIGRETVAHVSHVFQYYVAYRLIAEKEAMRAAGLTGLGPR
jgi:membrane-bound lytic murein transglycosylase MltF